MLSNSQAGNSQTYGLPFSPSQGFVRHRFNQYWTKVKRQSLLYPCHTIDIPSSVILRRAVGREAEFGGAPCEGERRETAPCVENECAVDGEWSDWSPWGYCDREGRRAN